MHLQESKSGSKDPCRSWVETSSLSGWSSCVSWTMATILLKKWTSPRLPVFLSEKRERQRSTFAWQQRPSLVESPDSFFSSSLLSSSRQLLLPARSILISRSLSFRIVHLVVLTIIWFCWNRRSLLTSSFFFSILDRRPVDGHAPPFVSYPHKQRRKKREKGTKANRKIMLFAFTKKFTYR